MVRKKIAIYAEAGKTVGLGHVVRSSALATFFKEFGCQVDFLIKKEALTKNVKLELREFNVILIPKGVAKFKWMAEYLEKESPCILSIDSYDVTSRNLRNLKKSTKILVSIDDLAKIRFPSDIIVNGNVYAPMMRYKTCGRALLLLGTRYAILRPVFQRIRKKSIKKRVRNVLITMGGADLAGITLPILKTVIRAVDTKEINVVLGPYFTINRIRCKVPHIKNLNFYKFPSPETLKNLMEQADLAISAGGQTLYELARCGVPTIGICVGEDQKKNLRYLDETGCCINLGWAKSEKLTEKLKANLEALCNNDIRRRDMSMIGRKLVDGFGGPRVARILMRLMEDKTSRGEWLKP